ncbi:hypothetical protein BMETH_31311822761398, partial [methanotrophic bacterial endosymbiont of Bathymodiolus sp.]
SILEVHNNELCRPCDVTGAESLAEFYINSP